MKLYPITQFDADTQMRALLRRQGLMAYCPESNVALIRSSGRSKYGLTTYLIRVREWSCPRIKAASDGEAIEKANQWLERNARKYEAEIKEMKVLLPGAALVQSKGANQ
jgi:hypothetical protein